MPSSSVPSSLGRLRCRRERHDFAAESQQAKWRGWSRLREPRLAVQVHKPLSSAGFQAPVRAKPRTSRGLGRLPAAALNVERKEYSYYNWWSVAGSWPRSPVKIWQQSERVSARWIIRQVCASLRLTIISARGIDTSSIFGCWLHVDECLYPLIISYLSNRARM